MKTRVKSIRLALLVAVLLGCVGAWLGLRWLEDSYQEKPYSLVEPGLYVGSSVAEPPPGTKAVVNLCGREDLYTAEAQLWEPILEAGAKEPDVEWLRQVVSFIDTHRQAGRTTYVHCMAGVNRSAAVTTAYLMYEHGWGRDEAVTFLRAKRPLVQPAPNLMRLLAEWERSLQEQQGG